MLLAELRPQFVADIRFAERAATQNAPSAAPPPPPPPPQAPPVAAPWGADGGYAGGNDPQSTLAHLLAVRSREIEASHRERCKQSSQQLVRAYQQQMAQLQASLLTELAELGEASQRQMQHELDGFMREGLPAIQSILAGRSLPAAAAATPSLAPSPVAAVAAAAPPATTTLAPPVAMALASAEPGGAGEGGGYLAPTSYVDLGTLIGQNSGADPQAMAPPASFQDYISGR